MKSGTPDKEISILLPAYNEAAQIEKCVHEVEAAAKSFFLLKAKSEFLSYIYRVNYNQKEA